MDTFLFHLEFYGIPAGIFLAAVLSGIILYFIFVKIIGIFIKKYGSEISEIFIRRYRSPFRLIMPLVAVYISVNFMDLEPEPHRIVDHVLRMISVFSFSWLLVRFVYVFEDYMNLKYAPGKISDIEARKIQTQVHFFKRIAVVLIVLIATAIILMTFNTVRELGATILASAGIAGIILGFAAQNTLGTLFAGLQVAITQPIRIGDSVTIEGEFGTVEEITLTYVVVRIWDLRRLVLPIKYFIENPIWNWTMTSADVLGTVLFHVDFMVPVDELREEFNRIITRSPSWDGKTSSMVVTDLTEKTMEVRALMSAADSGKLFDLRCEVREKIILFLREKYPWSLPRLRVENSDPSGSPGSAVNPGEAG